MYKKYSFNAKNILKLQNLNKKSIVSGLEGNQGLPFLRNSVMNHNIVFIYLVKHPFPIACEIEVFFPHSVTIKPPFLNSREMCIAFFCRMVCAYCAISSFQ